MGGSGASGVINTIPKSGREGKRGCSPKKEDGAEASG
jgi:hypothetical protein